MAVNQKWAVVTRVGGGMLAQQKPGGYYSIFHAQITVDQAEQRTFTCKWRFLRNGASELITEPAKCKPCGHYRKHFLTKFQTPPLLYS